METTLELFQYVEAMMGGECVCGGSGLACTEECCGEEAMENRAGFCQKDVLTTLKEVLEEFEALKMKEAIRLQGPMEHKSLEGEG